MADISRASSAAPLSPTDSDRRQPPGLFLLFVVEMWERFSYYGMRALLVLYLVAIIAAPDLKPGSYTTTLDIKHRASINEDERKVLTLPEIDAKYPWTIQTHTVTVAIDTAAEPVQATGVIEGGLIVSTESNRVFSGSSNAFERQSLVLNLRNTTSVALDYDIQLQWPGEAALRENPQLLYDKPVAVNIGNARDATSGALLTATSAAALVGKIEPGQFAEISVATNAWNSGRGWRSSWAANLYGWYTGMVYLLPILGGLIADRFLGTHRSMLVGGVLIALGHIVLAASGFGELATNAAGMSVFVFGLALIVMGTGHFKPCVSVMVGQLYRENDPRRDGGFSIFYMGINLGAFLSAFVCGTLGELYGWHWGFGAAAVGMILGLVTYLIGRPKLLSTIGLPPAGRSNLMPQFTALSILTAAGVAYLFHIGVLGVVDDGFNWLFGNWIATLAFILAVLGVIGWFIAMQRPGDRAPVFSIFTFIGFNVLFWVAFEQAGTSLNLFANDKTDRFIGNWEVPTTWFQSINAFVIILCAPLFGLMWSWLGRRNMNPTQAVKIAMGLILLGVGYLFMVYAGGQAQGTTKVAIWWITLTYVFHTFGELCLSPTGLSYVTKTAPVRFMSLLMGVWFLSSFVAGVAGGKLAALTERIETGEIQLFWYQWFKIGGQGDFYLLFVIFSIIPAIFLLIVSPFFKRALGSKA